MSFRQNRRFSNSFWREESPTHHSMVPTQLVVNEIFTLQQDIDGLQRSSHQHTLYKKEAETQIREMERQLKSKAIDIDRYNNSITRLREDNISLTRERDVLSADNDCLFKDNELLQEENTRLKRENKRTSSVVQHKHAPKNSLRNNDYKQCTLLEKYLKMKNETVPELRKQIHSLKQKGRSICSHPRYAL